MTDFEICSGYKMPFGKYAGYRLGDVPTEYLEWFRSSVRRGQTLQIWIETELLKRKGA